MVSRTKRGSLLVDATRVGARPFAGGRRPLVRVVDPHVLLDVRNGVGVALICAKTTLEYGQMQVAIENI